MFTYNNMDMTFQALAHKTRRTILDIIKTTPGCSVGELAKHFDVSRIAIMNHLGVLEKAGLITSEKDGRSRRLYINVAPLQVIYERWTDEYSSYFATQMIDIKKSAEQNHRSKKGE